ncbi:MAG: hypothetical protein A2487_17530 [Candidatus Raymondbacteria bacterium RifOxyC12_full_50_8]|uniref:Histidine kinase/HSP90-like ATPase domain-containing protein n=1 Tax=Candidatus Raymondbacteria bacterium RIFOXYD12_FULL_49_13 TaxID=1817890 RepID=A0A1F7FC80_UNCRA|nr:MAG: hypothetical protein A2248_02985 [Candidatus Raymondbacteria bacterium RIFOXYA2_FULL_49_16]OGJ94210.1 MAG: hypothetical protein A2487_17530 [Candidatus Raymondbacteria bacterium RifOxyC12_full_50_8]OGK04295.1 MAG: hypothetical protein A2519_18225 [Candidatus Raymondbacteria bacterium RIFOXYD12_FULL_49_13]OGP42422.1 MAG: hypothetical protein A2324_17020 [Candidatus Raymondbacteria bacterium RIFOXYB2_FULL_49_35]
MQKALTFPCSLKVLDTLRAETETFCRTAGMDAIASGEIELAINEACTNIVRHSGLPGAATFSVVLSVENGVLTAVIADKGKPFDFDQARTIKDTSDLKTKKPASGMGVFFIRKLVDTVEYRRLPGGSNELTLKKKIQ